MTNYAADIPVSLAQSAHNGTSFVPERRAEQEREGYAETLKADYDSLSKLADTDEKRALLEDEFARYRAGYRAKTTAWLSSRSRIMSTMITGPANFPTERNRKRGDTAHKRLTELLEFRERALDAIRKKLCPELRPIMSGDADATERLESQIAEAERAQEHMKAVNAAIRKNLKAGKDAQRAALVALGISNALADELLTPDCMRSIGYPHYRLTNNNANIRRMKERLASISKAKAIPDSETQGEHARIEVSTGENRVRLFFPGKPPAEVRNKLKSNGFRWAPSIGCWQAYVNHRTEQTAREVAGIE